MIIIMCSSFFFSCCKKKSRKFIDSFVVDGGKKSVTEKMSIFCPISIAFVAS